MKSYGGIGPLRILRTYPADCMTDPAQRKATKNRTKPRRMNWDRVNKEARGSEAIITIKQELCGPAIVRGSFHSNFSRVQSRRTDPDLWDNEDFPGVWIFRFAAGSVSGHVNVAPIGIEWAVNVARFTRHRLGVRSSADWFRSGALRRSVWFWLGCSFNTSAVIDNRSSRWGRSGQSCRHDRLTWRCDVGMIRCRRRRGRFIIDVVAHVIRRGVNYSKRGDGDVVGRAASTKNIALRIK